MATPDTKPAHQKIAVSTNHPVVQEIAGLVKQGMSFQEILDKYTAERNLSPDKIAEIHEFKSRIQEALRIGTPIEQVINSVFTDPNIQQEVLYGIRQAKSANGL
jgi:hypothetical protein